MENNSLYCHCTGGGEGCGGGSNETERGGPQRATTQQRKWFKNEQTQEQHKGENSDSVIYTTEIHTVINQHIYIYMHTHINIYMNI